MKTLEHGIALKFLQSGAIRVVGPTENDPEADWLLETKSPWADAHYLAPGPLSWGVLVYLQNHGGQLSRMDIMINCKATYRDLDDLVRDKLIEPFANHPHREVWFRLPGKENS